MTAEEFGAYWRLLLIAWQQDPAASLPADEDQLARWGKLGTARWKACRERILALFVKGRDGRWHHPELRKEYERVIALTVKRKRAGQAGARGRWGDGKRIANAC